MELAMNLNMLICEFKHVKFMLVSCNSVYFSYEILNYHRVLIK